MNLTPEEREIGKQNFHEAVGSTRRDFLKGTIVGGTTAGVTLGGMYFGYGAVKNERLRLGIIGTGDEGGVLIGAINPEFIDVRAIADIRPYSIYRAFHGDNSSPGTKEARPGLMEVYDWKTEDEARKNVKVFEHPGGGYKQMIDEADELDLEAVIVALPLHLHDEASNYAMSKGLHVLTEKLMAHSVRQCKEMSRVAEETGLILSTGHQRHYSILYDNAVDQIRRGLIGDIHHIRAQWHRDNLPGNDSWQPPMPLEGMFQADEMSFISEDDFIAMRREVRAEGGTSAEADLRNEYKLLDELFAWRNRRDRSKGDEADEWAIKVAQKEQQIRDFHVEAAEFGYLEKTLPTGDVRSPLEELIRWRLWDRTGGGLMAELGSHQLDAASIFISAQNENGEKVMPLSVTGVGGRHIFPPDRDVDDHVYTTYEFPGQGYYEKGVSGPVADPNKKICVTYSSINGNGFGGYGEVVLGTAGTLILEREKEVMLYKRSQTQTKISIVETKGGPAMDTYETGGAAAAVAQAAIPTDVSRGYREQMEHFAWCIRNPSPENQVKCPPKVALADAVIALTSNIAMARNERIEFKPEWFDIQSDETPEGEAPRPVSQLI